MKTIKKIFLTILLGFNSYIAAQIEEKSYNKIENLPEFIDSTRISHILVDGHENRPHYLNDVFLNEKKYSYLTKIYDSQDDNLMYHVKIFEIDYEKFIPYANALN